MKQKGRRMVMRRRKRKKKKEMEMVKKKKRVRREMQRHAGQRGRQVAMHKLCPERSSLARTGD